MTAPEQHFSEGLPSPGPTIVFRAALGRHLQQEPAPPPRPARLRVWILSASLSGSALLILAAVLALH